MAVTGSALQDQLHSLYSDHHGWLFGWLRKKIGCAHQAADVVQDTFVRIVASRDTLLGMREPRAYLTTTAKRLLIDRARRDAIERAYLAELAIHADAQEGFPSPDEILIAVQALDQLSVALETASVKAREAFLLHYLEGLTHAEMAAHFGVSTRMVQKYLVQALVACQSAIEGVPA